MSKLKNHRDTVVLDFDGIFADKMIYTESGKWAKTFTWGIRHSIDLLVEHGFKVYIITGDSTKSGQAITKKFLHNVKITDIIFCKSTDKYKILKQRFDLNKIYYSGDDVYDIEIFKSCHGITHKNTHFEISRYAKYVSEYTPNDYYTLDLANYILINENKINDLSDTTVHTRYENSADYLCDLRYKNIYILQQYSMRNHTDNLYNPLLDGNLNITLHRIYKALQFNKDLKFTITMPLLVNKQQYNDLVDFIDKYIGKDRISFEPLDYGLNAMDNMQKFIDKGSYTIDKKYDLFISYFPIVANQKTILMYNISKTDDLEREYIDKFFDRQLDQLDYTNVDFCYVLNENQSEKLNHSKVLIDKEYFNVELFKNQQRHFLFNSTNGHDLDTVLKILFFSYPKSNFLFFPFRLSDKAYQWDRVIEDLKSSNSNNVIFITDPNNSFNSDEYKGIENVTIVNLSKLLPKHSMKQIYLSMLEQLKDFNILVMVYENPMLVLHMSILEIYIKAPNNILFLNLDNKTFNADYDKTIKNYLKERICQ